MNELSTIDCVHFGPCSGCTLSGKVDFPPIWNEVQKYFLSHHIEADLIRGAVCQWRTKAKLAVRKNGDRVQIGLFQTGSHTVVPIPNCQVHHPSINLVIHVLTDLLQKENFPIYDEKSHLGLLRYIQCFVELKTQKVQLVLVVKEDQSILRSLCEKLQKSPLFHSIWINIQPSVSNRIFGDQWIHLIGKKFLKQELLGHPFYFHPAAFSQVHWALFERLVADVEKWIEADAKLAEIYAGIGMMGTVYASKCKKVDLIESNPFAEMSFQRGPSYPNIKYFLQDASNRSLLDADHILIDPPRKGVDKNLLNKIKKFHGKLIYISCNFQTFVRDVSELMDAGFILKEARCYLFFPGTDHVEVTALLTSASGLSPCK